MKVDMKKFLEEPSEAYYIPVRIDWIQNNISHPAVMKYALLMAAEWFRDQGTDFNMEAIGEKVARWYGNEISVERATQLVMDDFEELVRMLIPTIKKRELSTKRSEYGKRGAEARWGKNGK